MDFRYNLFTGCSPIKVALYSPELGINDSKLFYSVGKCNKRLSIYSIKDCEKRRVPLKE